MMTVLPPLAPRKGNRFTRWLGASLLKLLGWTVEGELPNEPKLILAGAPHTSNWDFVFSMLVVLTLGLKASYLMKKEAFFWPFAGLFKWLGGVPVARGRNGGMVESLAGWFTEQEACWLMITPDGTRRKVKSYKTGFLRVAELAQVPVMLVSWDYASKRVVLEKVWATTGDHEADCQAIRQYLTSRYEGRQPEWQ
ncbi:1-acyl-sn-glycerol-3-phosphate acyltransferase [Marinagarivorans algicola]|uniref:1-acyl-sn-glycerol-3-phosphate acyltransferase n=1 Tax=Marinagarivorans algicola TaxID=1513270 RepID=UPI0006B63809|nr:1-acyl-sn-glycerol-3-phosphate acyltransferase [Marinagarivorans algicola]